MSRGAWRDEESIITCLKGKGTPEDPELFGRGWGDSRILSSLLFLFDIYYLAMNF